MSEIFKLIENKSLTSDRLANLIEEGEDINTTNEEGFSPLILACRAGDIDLARILLNNLADVDNRNQNDEEDVYRERPLTIAIEMGNIEMVKLLIEYGADLYLMNEDECTPLMLAYRAHDIQLLSLLLKYKAKFNANCRECIKKYPDRYEDHYKNWFLSEEEFLDNHTAADICSIIKKNRLLDEELKSHQRVLTLLDSVKFIDFAVDLSGGNAEDKIEIMTLEIGDREKIRLDYLYMYNWSYGETHLILKSTDMNGELDLFKANEDYQEISLQSLKHLCDLANALELNDLTFKAFIKFIILIVSRMVQKEYLPLEEHGLYIRINPDEAIEPDEQLSAHFSHTPICELHFDGH